MTGKAPTFLVVDDHPTMRQIHCSCLEQINAEAHCVHCADPQVARERLQLETPDLAVIDLMYQIGGIQTPKPGLALLEEIFSLYPLLNLLVCSSDPLLLRPLTTKIMEHEGGFIVVDKNQTSEKFIQGARNALDGIVSLPKFLRTGIDISDVEQTLLRLMCEDCLITTEIARSMNLSKRTVEYHITGLRDKLLTAWDDNTKNIRLAICQAAQTKKLL